MKFLALDTSSALLSIALFDNGDLAGFHEEDAAMRQSEQLVPALLGLLKKHGWGVGDLGAVALSAGPGSFTGLRGGLAFAKGLALGQGSRIVAVSSLKAYAVSLEPEGNDLPLAVFLDGRKEKVYFAAYECGKKGHRELAFPSLVDARKAFDLAPRPSLLAGDGLEKYPGVFAALVRDNRVLASRARPLAAAVGWLALDRIEKQDFDEAGKVEPFYLRATEAELKKKAGHP